MSHEHIDLGKQAGLLWTWWRGDALPTLQIISGFAAEVSTDITLLAYLMECSAEEVMQLLQEEHRPYVASINDVPVAVGWSATNKAEFGQGRVQFYVPAHNRYLYFFVTLPEWRGLQAIVRTESSENERFWIIHQRENIASERGIAKAGFRIASKVYFLSDDNNTLCFVHTDEEIERARAGATMFGLSLMTR